MSKQRAYGHYMKMEQSGVKLVAVTFQLQVQYPNCHSTVPDQLHVHSPVCHISVQYTTLLFVMCSTGNFQFVPSLPPPSEHNPPLRDRMLKRPDTEDGFSRRRGDLVSIISEPYDVYVCTFVC